MTDIEKWLEDYERVEDEQDMKFSVYSIPEYYQPEEDAQ